MSDRTDKNEQRKYRTFGLSPYADVVQRLREAMNLPKDMPPEKVIAEAVYRLEGT